MGFSRNSTTRSDFYIGWVKSRNATITVIYSHVLLVFQHIFSLAAVSYTAQLLDHSSQARFRLTDQKRI